MPSIASRPWNRIPPTRYQLLQQLRKNRMRRKALLNFFDNTIGRLLQTQRTSYTATGVAKTKIQLPTPKRRHAQFYQLLYELKRDELIKENCTDPEGKIYEITARGAAWLNEFPKRSITTLPSYDFAEKQERVTIVSYDIPQRLNLYRRWLREVLLNLGFTKMQRSVWIGKVKLPAEFIDDITRFKLEKCIEIFEITKTGTLRHRI